MSVIQSVRQSWRDIPENPRNFETVSRRRMQSLKDVFKGRKAVIFTCGPSLSSVSQSQIHTLIDKGYIIVCVKQAIESMPNKFCHFHVVNFCNEKQYSYTTDINANTNSNSKPITIYCQFSEGRIDVKPGYDIVVSHYPNNLNDNIAVSMARNEDVMSFDKLLDRDNLKVKWGDTMYELAIPIALYVGCTHIYIVGWDCKNLKQHFYGSDSRPPRDDMRQKLDKLLVETSSCLARFLNDKFGVTVKLIGNGDESVFDIPYLSLCDLLKE